MPRPPQASPHARCLPHNRRSAGEDDDTNHVVSLLDGADDQRSGSNSSSGGGGGGGSPQHHTLFGVTPGSASAAAAGGAGVRGSESVEREPTVLQVGGWVKGEGGYGGARATGAHSLLGTSQWSCGGQPCCRYKKKMTGVLFPSSAELTSLCFPTPCFSTLFVASC